MAGFYSKSIPANQIHRNGTVGKKEMNILNTNVRKNYRKIMRTDYFNCEKLSSLITILFLYRFFFCFLQESCCSLSIMFAFYLAEITKKNYVKTHKNCIFKMAEIRIIISSICFALHEMARIVLGQTFFFSVNILAMHSMNL